MNYQATFPTLEEAFLSKLFFFHKNIHLLVFCLDEWWVGLMGWSPAPSVKHGNWLHRAASQTLFEEINVFATIVFLKGRHDIKITWWFISFLWNLSSAENHEFSSPRFDPNRSPYPISVIVLVWRGFCPIIFQSSFCNSSIFHHTHFYKLHADKGGNANSDK